MQQSRMTKPHCATLPLSLKANQRRLAIMAPFSMAPFRNFKASLFALVCLLALAFSANAQSPTPTPQLIMPTAAQPLRVAGKSSLYCAGYIRYQRLPPMPEIDGALEEQEQHTYADGDVVYLNTGSSQGVKEGQSFQIIRPRGDVKGVHKQKYGYLGTYVQDIASFKSSRSGKTLRRRR